MKRIAITMRHMRVEYPNGNAEERDALATDWGHLLADILPETLWLPLPNVGSSIVDVVQELGITGLIFSGGEDWGSSALRDTTEQALFSWAYERHLPVLGVCRGAQVLHRLLGGGDLCPINGHAGTRHMVRWSQNLREVNSYHHWGIPSTELAPNLTPLALTEDGLWVEAFRHVHLPWLGLLWHPEREVQTDPEERAVLRHLFLEET